jgi:hypothetical protein
MKQGFVGQDSSFSEKLLLGKLERKGNVAFDRVKDDGKVDACRKLLELVDARLARTDLRRNDAQHVVWLEIAAYAIHKGSPALPRHQVAKLVARVHQDRVAALFDEFARIVLVGGRRLGRPIVGLQNENVTFAPHVERFERLLRLVLHTFASSRHVDNLDVLAAQKVEERVHFARHTAIRIHG